MNIMLLMMMMFGRFRLADAIVVVVVEIMAYNLLGGRFRDPTIV
uniref:Uncharacterized protein n=1 Tax=Spodoptera exigua multiple nucleopolyhedrovirus TaxID=10454 RepID=A0A6N0C384_9ABAC|nr:hypothetical protein [Spodoptera exigua multiple nucleopolyhedrovirus]